MLELGEFSSQEHYELGLACNSEQIDYSFFIGQDFKSFKKGIKNQSKCFSTANRQLFLDSIKNYVIKGGIKKET